MLICDVPSSLSDLHTSTTCARLSATQKMLTQYVCFFLRMRCVIFFDTLPSGFGDSFVAPHLLPGTNCIMNPERMPVSAPSNECLS